MTDWNDGDFPEPGYYRVFWGRTQKPIGPAATMTELAGLAGLTDYPDDGMIVHVEDDIIGSVPSINPDDLLPRQPAQIAALKRQLLALPEDLDGADGAVDEQECYVDAVGLLSHAVDLLAKISEQLEFCANHENDIAHTTIVRITQILQEESP